MSSYLVYTDSESITFDTKAPDHNEHCDALYAAQKNNADVHTSQITPYRYIDTWTPELQKGYDILYISFSSGMSATYQNAQNAADQLKDDFPDRTIECVDSLAATGGQGVITYCAAMNQANGMSLEENAAWLREKIPYMCHRFTVGDLGYLHKGGRVSAAVALIGGVLDIKPLLIIDDEGKLEMVGKARGRNAALKGLLKDYVAEMGVEGVPKVVFITHTSLYKEADHLADMLRQVAEPGTEVYTICETPIIGVHTGPDFFSICGWGKRRKRK